MQLTYVGNRQVTRRTKVGTLPGDPFGVIETDSDTIERYDRQGRLFQVVEPSGGSGANVTTSYSYDVGNRLRQASTAAVVGGPAVTQIRVWTFDQRGVLNSEQHPEKGAAGNGTVSYSGYDARGHATRRIDGPNDLTYVFDKAERLTLVRETGGAQRPLKQFSYSSTPGRSLGKLLWADRYNYVTISGSPNTGRVRESYAYEARGGRVSERTTELFINGNPTPSDRWAQGFEYTPLGEVDLLIYPYCVSGGCMDAKFSRDVEFLHARGWLSRVPASARN